jgi:hypothetical protein
VPESGTLAITYAVRLAIKPYDRGVFFSPAITTAAFHRIIATLEGKLLGPEPRQPRAGAHPPPGDFDKVNLLRQAAMRNYFTSVQVKTLVDLVAYRKNKIETAVVMHPRTTDQANFVHALKSLDKETDRQDILEMVGASIKRKMRKEIKVAAAATATVTACSCIASAAAAARVPASQRSAPAEGAIVAS